MKSLLRLGAALLLALPFHPSHAQRVGVGTATPATSAALDVTSTSGGLLLPRMTAAQRNAIASPTAGLLVFQTNGTPGLYYFVGGGRGWLNLSNGQVPDADGNAGSSPAALVSTLAGSTNGSANGTGAAAQFNSPSGVAADGSGNVFVADRGNNRIRQIVVATGAVSTLAGSTAGSLDGTGAAAQFNFPAGVAADGGGNVFVADQNSRIRRIVVATGAVSTLAGGINGFADGTGATARFNSPAGVSVDGSGNVFVADQNNNRIRRIRP